MGLEGTTGFCNSLFIDVPLEPFHPAYIALAIDAICLIGTLAALFRNISLKVAALCFSNVYLVSVILYFVLYIIQVATPISYAVAGCQLVLCRELPNYLMFVASIVLLAYLSRFCALVRDAATQRGTGWWTTAALVVLAAYTTAAVMAALRLPHSPTDDDLNSAAKVFIVVDCALFGTITLILTIFAVRAYNLLRVISLHPQTISVIKRVERALAVILIASYVRVLWAVLTLTNANPFYRWLPEDPEEHEFGMVLTNIIYTIFTQAVPLAAGVYAVLPDASASRGGAARPPRRARFWRRQGRSQSSLALLDNY